MVAPSIEINDQLCLNSEPKASSIDWQAVVTQQSSAASRRRQGCWVRRGSATT
jgi:hypothetical protein